MTTTQTGADGQIEYAISKTADFNAFWANAYAEFGYLNYGNDFMVAANATIQANGSLTSSATGLQLTVTPLSWSVVVDAGKKFELVNGLSTMLTVANAEAIYNDAQAVMQQAEVRINDMETALTELESSLEQFEMGVFDMFSPAAQVTL